MSAPGAQALLSIWIASINTVPRTIFAMLEAINEYLQTKKWTIFIGFISFCAKILSLVKSCSRYGLLS
jgi:hypothetical protein